MTLFLCSRFRLGFRQALMDTKDALLIVCDPRDSDLGIGMDEDAFVDYTRRRRLTADAISLWMQDEKSRPPEVGQNQLGFFLMWLRYEIRLVSEIAKTGTDFQRERAIQVADDAGNQNGRHLDGSGRQRHTNFGLRVRCCSPGRTFLAKH